MLRTYLARRADIPALETTTRELVIRLRSALEDGIVPKEIVGEMEDVLLHADLVKFADMKPGNEAGHAALSRTSSAIIGTEKEFTAREEVLREEADREAPQHEDVRSKTALHEAIENDASQSEEAEEGKVIRAENQEMQKISDHE